MELELIPFVMEMSTLVSMLMGNLTEKALTLGPPAKFTPVNSKMA